MILLHNNILIIVVSLRYACVVAKCRELFYSIFSTEWENWLKGLDILSLHIELLFMALKVDNKFYHGSDPHFFYHVQTILNLFNRIFFLIFILLKIVNKFILLMKIFKNLKFVWWFFFFFINREQKIVFRIFKK